MLYSYKQANSYHYGEIFHGKEVKIVLNKTELVCAFPVSQAELIITYPLNQVQWMPKWAFIFYE